MIKRKGDVFTSDQFFIGHGANCKGIMGAGVAKRLRELYPINFAKYHKACKEGGLTPGWVVAFPENGKVIVHLATQDEPGKNARYEWVFNSVYTAALRILGTPDTPNAMAIPMIGSGIGGLEWDKVEAILHCVETLLPEFEFEVWKFEG